MKLIKVGIFWAVPNTWDGGWNFYELVKSYELSAANSLGFIDYPYSHYDKWDDVRSSSETPDCYHYPRGRVLYDTKQNKHRIFADECLDEFDLQEIVELFEIEDFELCRDEHYVSSFTKKHKQEVDTPALTYNVLRGKDKIGENLIEISYGDTKLLVELGKALDGDDELSEIEKNVLETPYNAVIVSHYHADHAGLIGYKKDCPIYIGKGAYRILNAMSEYRGGALASNITTYQNGKPLYIGGIKITPFLCDHSAFDSYMLLFEAGGKSIFYTGDFRFHGRKDKDKLLSCLPQKVDTFICEGTNANSDKPCFSESELEERLLEMMRQSEKPVFVLQSSANIDRLVSVYKAAKHSGRILYEDNYVALIAQAAGGKIPRPDVFKDVYAFTPRMLYGKRKDMFSEVDNRRGLRQIPNNGSFVMLVRPSMLDYIKKLASRMDLSGATLIYSLWSGYREQPEMAEFLKEIEKIGIQIKTLHTSGHAPTEDIELLKQTVHADEYISVHTNPKQFVHLHVHSEYSLLSSAAKIGNLFKACEEMNMPAIAITDNGNLYGALKFVKQAAEFTEPKCDFSEFMKKQKPFKIKPIIGCEVYCVPDRFAKKTEDGEMPELNRLVLLAKNEEGYHNLVKIVSSSFTEGFDKPRMDMGLLKEYKTGLICLSAGLSGALSQAILSGDFEKADSIAKEFKEIFGEDYYIELQNHKLLEQETVLPHLVSIAKNNGIKLVATNDVHYVTKSDAITQKVLHCIACKKTMTLGSENDGDDGLPTDEFYLKSREQMEELFPDLPEALDNTIEIMNKCEPPYWFEEKSFLPQYVPSDGSTSYEFLRKLTLDGLNRKYKKVTKEIATRADHELGIINEIGFVNHFLIVWDIINFAEANDIPVGPGRGSVVGSIVAYAIGITKVNPLKHGLIFERFLNPACVSKPDFDIDVCTDRRGEVIDYVTQKYGAENVSQIITFGILTAKAAVKDVGRVFNYPYSELDKIATLIPFSMGKKHIGDLLGFGKNPTDTVPKLKEMYDSEPMVKSIMDMAQKIEGMPRMTNTHASGVIICCDPICEHVPMARTNEGILTTQFIAAECEEIELLKINFLGLRTLTDIKKSLDIIRKTKGIELDFSNMYDDDKGVFEMIGEGDTDAVFLLESAGMKRFMRDLRPTSFEDIMASISLYRPGLIGKIDEFVYCKKYGARYTHPLLAPILGNTYGVMIYQEQIMEIVCGLAGYPMARADTLWHIMSKKETEKINAERQVFLRGLDEENGHIPGAIKNGISEEVANNIFDDMVALAPYAFNKSHAAAYAMLTYQTAYLQRYYPAELNDAILNNKI